MNRDEGCERSKQRLHFGKIVFIEVSKQGILKEVCKEARDIVFLSYFGTPTISKIITLKKI